MMGIIRCYDSLRVVQISNCSWAGPSLAVYPSASGPGRHVTWSWSSFKYFKALQWEGLNWEDVNRHPKLYPASPYTAGGTIGLSEPSLCWPIEERLIISRHVSFPPRPSVAMDGRVCDSSREREMAGILVQNIAIWNIQQWSLWSEHKHSIYDESSRFNFRKGRLLVWPMHFPLTLSWRASYYLIAYVMQIISTLSREDYTTMGSF